MPELIIEFHPSALKEAESAQLWYADRSEAASIAFIAELTHAVNKITESPNRWPKYHKDTRRYFFPRFPFSLIYRFTEEQLVVIAVMHHRRKPGYWAKRS